MPRRNIAVKAGPWRNDSCSLMYNPLGPNSSLSKEAFVNLLFMVSEVVKNSTWDHRVLQWGIWQRVSTELVQSGLLFGKDEIDILAESVLGGFRTYCSNTAPEGEYLLKNLCLTECGKDLLKQQEELQKAIYSACEEASSQNRAVCIHLPECGRGFVIGLEPIQNANDLKSFASVHAIALTNGYEVWEHI